jgi:hypothetical protein
MEKHLRYGLITLSLLVGLWPCWVNAGISNPTREEIQTFLRQPGNGIMSPEWTHYLEKRVSWEGTIYEVNLLDDGSAEVLIKVMPASYLYDTVLTVPAGHAWNKSLKAGQVLRFQGVVTGAVDTVFLKEVHVTLFDERPSGASG